MKLDKKIAAWREAGLVTAEQAHAIVDFEQRRSGSRHFVVLALGGVGVLALATGLISVIASNWDSIPAAVKLAGAFALLAGSLAAAHRLSREGQTLGSDLFLAAHAGILLAMIGVVGQVYHLSGAPWRALALAAVLALPAAAISERSLLTDIAIAYALAALGLFLGESRAAQPYLAGFGWPLLGASVGGALSFFAELLGRPHPAAARALRRWGTGLLFVAAVTAATAWSYAWASSTRFPLAVLSGLVAAGWLARFALARKFPLALATLALTALVLGAAFVGGRTSTWSQMAPGLRFLGFALFCLAGGAFAVAAAQAGSRRLTNLFTLAVAGRIVVLFLEMLSTLALTGFGLLLTGAVFCGVAWAWWRLHTVLPVKEAGP